MARTRLFSLMTRALAAAQRASGESAQAMSRRDVLRLTAASAGVLAASAPFAMSSSASAAKANPRVAIVGGGAAGLTAAYRLQAQGIAPTVFEASNRWGGRMFTMPDFYHGMFCELGGEFIDSRHDDLRALAEELGLSLEPLFLAEERGRDLYFFGGRLRVMTDMLDPASGGGAFVPIANQIAADKALLRDEKQNYTAHARGLDAISLSDYLKQFRGKAENWAIDLILVAYTIEFGLDPDVQSSLNLVDFIAADLTQPFQIFGDSDEAFRIKGGSSALIGALVEASKKLCRLVPRSPLTGLRRRGTEIEVTLGGSTGPASEIFDVVLLALPFTRLRQVQGIEALGLSAEKLAAIRELGYGDNAKIMCGTKARPWRTGSLPYPSNGNFYSDLPFQAIWETSRAQLGARGIITNFVAGKTAPSSESAAFETLQKGLEAISPELGASLDKSAVTSLFWRKHPHTLGSYACALVGQYTTLLPVAKKPECEGRIHFAGEHTEPDFLGYMNGAVLSGNRAARDILMEAG